MIVLIPDYDEATQANAIIAEHVRFPVRSSMLVGEYAMGAQLRDLLEKAPSSLFAMSHGSPNTLFAQGGEAALSVEHAELVAGRQVFAFACHTASHLGREVARTGGCWWGYTGSISAPSTHARLITPFAELFSLLVSRFAEAETSAEVICLMGDLTHACEELATSIDGLADEDADFNPLGAHLALRHLWDRLRVWMPHALEPLKHPDARPPLILD